MRNALIAVMILFGALVAVSAVTMITIARQPPKEAKVFVPGADDAGEPDQTARGVEITPFRLIDQSGREFDESIFDGRVTIVDFIFTDCPFICPTLSGTMSLMAEELAGTGVRFVSVSVNPERDTPGRLAEYAARFKADPDVWTFATGDREVVYGLVENGFKFALAPDPSRTIPLGDGTTMENIRHPAWFALVGPGRRVLGIYHSSDDDDVHRLIERAREVSAR